MLSKARDVGCSAAPPAKALVLPKRPSSEPGPKAPTALPMPVTLAPCTPKRSSAHEPHWPSTKEDAKLLPEASKASPAGQEEEATSEKPAASV